MTEASIRRERIREEAVDWIVRLSDSSTELDKAACEAWRALSIDHEIIYLHELAAWRRLDRLAALRPANGDVDPDILALRQPAGIRGPDPRKWLAVAASVVLLVGGSTMVGWSLTASQAYATGVGERRLVALDDGTTVELNTDSRIEVKYGKTTRSIRLVKGEAVFHIARDSRPFRLKTPTTTLDAETADLTVRLGDKDARIAVMGGVVEAREVAFGQGGQPLATLSGGAEALVSEHSARVHMISTDEVGRQLAWRQGAVAFNGQTLAEAVVEFNRYNNRKIRVSGGQTGAVRIGGYFQTSDVDGFVNVVTRTFPVEASRDATGEIVLSDRR